MATIHSDPHEFRQLVTLPANYQFVRRYVSQAITHADLTAGASCTVALTGEPTASVMLAAYVVTSVETTSSTGDTTGLTMKVGTAGLADGYANETDIFGAAGRKQSGAVTLSGYRAGDALIATFTATGGSPDCADIAALSVRFVLFYLTPAAES